MTGHDLFTIKSLEYQASYVPVQMKNLKEHGPIHPRLYDWPNKHLEFMIQPDSKQAQLALMEQNFQLHSQLRKAPGGHF